MLDRLSHSGAPGYVTFLRHVLSVHLLKGDMQPSEVLTADLSLTGSVTFQWDISLPLCSGFPTVFIH